MLEQIKDSESPNVPMTLGSVEVRDFIERCLKKKPEDRDTPISLLAHPWILKHTQAEADLPGYFAKLRALKDL